MALRTFYQWMMEMVGTGVVSPKPGADYQIWGDPKGSAAAMPKKRKAKKKRR